MNTRKTLIMGGVAAALAVAGFGGAYAQRAEGRGPGLMGQGNMGPGMMGQGMMGPGMMGHGMMAERFCSAKEPMAPRITNGIEKLLQPTDAQKADFEALKTAIAKAETDLKAACPTEAELADRTPPRAAEPCGEASQRHARRRLARSRGRSTPSTPSSTTPSATGSAGPRAAP